MKPPLLRRLQSIPSTFYQLVSSLWSCAVPTYFSTETGTSQIRLAVYRRGGLFVYSAQNVFRRVSRKTETAPRLGSVPSSFGDNNERRLPLFFQLGYSGKCCWLMLLTLKGKSHNASGVVGPACSLQGCGWMVSADVGAHVKASLDSALMLFTEGFPRGWPGSCKRQRGKGLNGSLTSVLSNSCSKHHKTIKLNSGFLFKSII